MSYTDEEILLILAPGRTGTVFIEDALTRHFSELLCRHEPPCSRAILMVGNFRNRTGIGDTALRALFRSVHEARFAAIPTDRRYVEINPMLCPVTDLVADWARESGRRLRVVHLVRDPRSWVRSICSFRASSAFRPVIDHVPFATPFPSPRPADWRRASPELKALWRWRFCNDQIRALEPACDRYVCIRYEDLFSDDDTRRRTAADQLLDGFELLRPVDPNGAPIDWFSIDERVNAAPHPSAEARRASDAPMLPESVVQAVCGDLTERFGYVASDSAHD